MSGDNRPDDTDGWSLFETGESSVSTVLHDVLITVGVVAAIAVVLFVASGVWPPLVAVESGSMQPHLQRGDSVFVSDPGRYAPDETVRNTGVIPAETAEDIDYRSLGGYGSVVIYSPPHLSGSPIIHRAHFWVEEGENWYDRANQDYVEAENCRELSNCPAPHAGFVTKGDANPVYDQTAGIPPVRPDWISGTAHARIPYLGNIRLALG